MNTMSKYSVRPDWRLRGIRIMAESPFDAVERASHWRDGRLRPFTHGTGMAQQVFDWGTRFERNQIFVDVVKL